MGFTWAWGTIWSCGEGVMKKTSRYPKFYKSLSVPSLVTEWAEAHQDGSIRRWWIIFEQWGFGAVV